MSWDRPDKDMTTFECDGCGEVEEFTASDFPSALKLAEADGWVPIKSVGHDWEHFCPKCGAAAKAAHERRKAIDRERKRIRDSNSR